MFLVEAWFGVRMRLKWILFGEEGTVSFKAKLDCIGKELCLSCSLSRECYQGSGGPSCVLKVEVMLLVSAVVPIWSSGRAVITGPLMP